MPEDAKPGKFENTPVLQILKQIKEGIFDPKDLDAEIRQDCVEHLWLSEGQSVAVIALLLKVSDKTIRRDKIEIRKRNARNISTDYSLQIFGELLEKATSSHENLIRLSRSSEGSLQEKSQAGYFAWKAIEEQIELAQKLGIAPSMATKIETTIRHEEEASPEQLKKELARLEEITSAKGITDPKIAKLVETVKGQIALAEAKIGIKELKTRIEEVDKGKSPT